jgi:hypothetical protein
MPTERTHLLVKLRPGMVVTSEVVKKARDTCLYHSLLRMTSVNMKIRKIATKVGHIIIFMILIILNNVSSIHFQSVSLCSCKHFAC